MYSLSDLNWHDAILKKINYDWKEKEMDMIIVAFLNDSDKKEAKTWQITFLETTQITIPHENPWGDSIYINSMTHKNGLFEIEMQSGDKITLQAKGVEIKN